MIGLFCKEGGRRDYMKVVLRDLNHDWTLKQKPGPFHILITFLFEQILFFCFECRYTYFSYSVEILMTTKIDL